MAPFVVTCEHARYGLPAGTPTQAPDRAALRTHWGWDIGAWELTRTVARLLGTGATGGRWSRLWIDLNRPPGDPTLARRVVEGHPLSWNRGLRAGELRRRFDEVHVPYHREIDREIARRLQHGVRPILLAVHTYTPAWNGRTRDYEAGVLYDEHRGPARRLAKALRASGLEVRYNEPYSGRRGLMYSIDRHGRAYGLPCLELEINQAMFERRGRTGRIARAVAEGMTDIEAYTRGG
jgi:predicted N-formylglutamate amidohydrolase